MKRKICLIVNFLVIAIFMLVTGVNAESGHTFKATVTPTESSIKPGGEVTISVNVSDINMGTNGINTVEGKIEYDKTIFEEVKSSSIQSFSNWTTTYNDESSTLNGKFLSVNLSSGVNENTKIFSVTFKAKKDISKTTSTQIKFNEITSNDGTDLISAGSKSVNITINVDNNIVETPTDSSNGSSNADTTEKNTQIVNTTDSDKTQAKTILPKAGAPVTIIFALAIVLLAVIIFAIKNKTMKDIK